MCQMCKIVYHVQQGLVLSKQGKVVGDTKVLKKVCLGAVNLKYFQKSY